MRTSTSNLRTDQKPPRWRRVQPFLMISAAAFTLSFGGGNIAAQDASPVAAPQPGSAECVLIEGGDTCLATAPLDQRVDLDTPVFSNPTAITNPHFPISGQAQLIQLGVDAGETLRAEATLMPGTKTITYEGQEVETLVSQFVSYGDGRLLEVAYDFYAQDDEGNVWYLGEDVFNYEDGVIKDTHGTWLAGKDGPAGMIMPNDPQVGDVFRPENIPGFVFEEVTIVKAGLTVNGPQGPVEGAVETSELLADGTLETKYFTPGYGEFSALVGSEYIIAALSVPLDARTVEMPAELDTLSVSATEIIEMAPSADWESISATTLLMSTVWEVAQAGEIPPVLALEMDRAIEGLEAAVEAEDAVETRQAALTVSRASLDIELQYDALDESDLDVMRLWGDQLVADAGSEDLANVSGDVATIETVWARVGHTVDQAFADQIDASLADLRAAVDAGDLTAATTQVAEYQAILDAVDAA